MLLRKFGSHALLGKDSTVIDRRYRKKKLRHLKQVAGFWRRPTLARPIAVLPSGLQRFTAVFGMGTGGATALLSPEIWAALVGANFWCVIRDSLHRYNGFPIHDLTLQRFTSSKNNFRASFCFEIIRLFCWLEPRTDSGLQRNRKVNDQAERVISIYQLNTLLYLYRRPINVVVYHDPSGRTHLGIGLALRCFQRLSFPNIANQHCS